MIKCVICYQNFVERTSFENLFKPQIYCNECLEKLNKIVNGCEYCSHPIGYNCCDKQIKNISLYFENQFLKDTLYQIKYYNLYNKIFLFEKDVYKFANDYLDYVVVPVPLSSIMNNKRGFNQSYIIASFTKLKIVNCLQRLDNITQSQKTYVERVNNPPRFKLKFLPKSKNIIIIDDIYTTGTTLKTIVKLFPKDYNIICFTIQRTILK